ncbi:MAG: ThiF family adenylyltransferase [archaeon]|nr:ThiF family adenylyltransferase [archaeon]
MENTDSNKKEEIRNEFQLIETTSIDDDIYDRQKRLKGWNQVELQNAHVLVIGAGATGNELIKNLIMVGIGEITIIDFDFINKANLNRCVFFTDSTAEKKEYKAEVVARNAKKLRKDVKINTFLDDLNNLPEKIYDSVDVVCSCLDNIEARIQANNYSYFKEKPFIDSGIDGFMGTIQCVFSNVPEAACFQCGITGQDIDQMWKKFSCTGEPIPGQEGETERKIATIVTTTSIIGGIQAQQVLKFILGMKSFKETKKWNEYIGAPLIGSQLLYNGINNTFRVITKAKNPKCWICGSDFIKKKQG